jgi:molybdate transport system regulatory protein
MKKKDRFSKQERSFPCLMGHIWIEGSEGTFLGYGRIALLERIREYGSITKAAKALEMSYRRAWVLIDSMNNQVPKPFVVTSAGGKRGGGTRVTAEGERAIAAFWKIHSDFQKFLRGKDRAVAAILGDGKEGAEVLTAKKRKLPFASAPGTHTHVAEKRKGA